MTTTHLLYLHGFRSSPRSAKAQQMAAIVEALNAQGQSVTWACPQLPPSPEQAWADIRAQVADWPHHTMAVMGSSLGGFYATVLAEKTGCPAVLINPAVAPARDLARYIGELSNFHDPDAKFFFRPEFIDEFKAIAPYPITRPERYLPIIAKGDEVLDWREMVAHYPGTPMTLLDGGDHALTDFAPHIPAVSRFLGLLR
ncbi:MAG: YqiA/YcfP family alpha/beta fold hydrolase [Aquabacterium sp.]|uniref:YqiA/YcfP family alpha/beta fold hydrolase n=1 Tax=Aquabacterium sp. TaxID=1872578 RepID=UPI0027219F5B|nr:YqiA/YcfP family alpha/beta fold hydrolase [Aquabacterium sp.]MDO9002188.1 YqiA/YcfP family alpha/beta fold hydrolase [Aquabacterium sp.]